MTDALDLINSCYSLQVIHIFYSIPVHLDHCKSIKAGEVVISVELLKLAIILFLQIMLTVARSFSYSVVCFFTLYRAVFYPTHSANTMIIGHTIWCMYDIIIIVIIIFVSSETTKEVCLNLYMAYNAFIVRHECNYQTHP